jgi:hypothetical protein
MWLRKRNVGWHGNLIAGQICLATGVLLGQAGNRLIPDLGVVAGIHMGDFLEGLALGMAAALLTLSIILNVRSWKQRRMESG